MPSVRRSHTLRCVFALAPDLCRGFDEQGDHHGVEQRLLVLEVVIEGAPRHSRGARDRLDPRRLIALARKGVPAGRLQRLPRGLGVFLAAGSFASGFLHAPTYHLTLEGLSTYNIHRVC